MKGIGLVLLMVAAFVAVTLYLKSVDKDISKGSDGSPSKIERMEEVQKTVDEFNKATEQRMKDLENIE